LINGLGEWETEVVCIDSLSRTVVEQRLVSTQQAAFTCPPRRCSLFTAFFLQSFLAAVSPSQTWGLSGYYKCFPSDFSPRSRAGHFL